MRPRDRAALLLVALAVTFSVLAVGGAPRWAACIGALLGVASAAPYITSRRTASKPSPLLLPLAVAAGLTALQLVPLPIAIAEQLVPAKLELVSANAAALDEAAPTWVMASYDPPATLVELAKLLGYLGLAYTCVRLATVRRARRALAELVAGVATLAALVTLVHHALGATSLYGVFTPEVQPHILGPLLGVNHLASLLSIATPIALALALASSGVLRVGWLASAVTLAGTTLLTGSRGGLLGLIAAVIVVVVLLFVQRKAGTDDKVRGVPLVMGISGAIVAVCTVILLAVLAAGDVASELSRTDLAELREPHSKFQVWDRAMTLVTDNRWLGVGKGGFEPAFTRVSEVGDLTYTHAENDYLQAVIDWGIPGAALLALVTLAAARKGLARWRHGPLEAGVIGGLASLIVHEMADFSLEIPGVATLAISAAAILFPDRLSTATDDAGARAASPPKRAVGSRASALSAAAAVVGLALSPIGRTMRSDADRVGDSGREVRLAATKDAWRRHPSDFVLAGRTAEALFAARDRRAVHVVARAIELAPLHPGMHHLAARVLAQTTARSQSAVEFAMAARLALDVRPVVADVLRTFPEPLAAAQALPPEPNQVARVIFALGDRKDVALQYARRVASTYPRDATAQWMLALQGLILERLEIALPAARAAWELQPAARHATMLGRALIASGDPAEAIILLMSAAESSVADPAMDRVELLHVLSEAQLQTSALPEAKTTLEQAELLARDSVPLQIETHERLADVATRSGNPNLADYERKVAAELRRSMSPE